MCRSPVRLVKTYESKLYLWHCRTGQVHLHNLESTALYSALCLQLDFIADHLRVAKRKVIPAFVIRALSVRYNPRSRLRILHCKEVE